MNGFAPRSLSLALMFAGAGALAQPAPSTIGPKVDAASGVAYVNGGAGAEEQQAIKDLQSQYPLRLVFSRADGAYLVVDKLTLRDAKRTVLTVADAGPLLLAKLPPGRYTADAEVKGAVQHKTIEVGRDAKAVNWNWGPVADGATR